MIYLDLPKEMLVLWKYHISIFLFYNQWMPFWTSFPPLTPRPLPQILFWLSYRAMGDDNGTLVLGQKSCNSLSQPHENTLSLFFFASVLIGNKYSKAERNCWKKFSSLLGQTSMGKLSTFLSLFIHCNIGIIPLGSWWKISWDGSK